jgi:hypothetical protein
MGGYCCLILEGWVARLEVWVARLEVWVVK